MADKRMTAQQVVDQLCDGMTIGIGGWGSRRKPMALVRAILESSLCDLTVVSYAGPDVGLLCAAGKVRRAVYGFASLDSIPLEPHFRRARESGAILATEYDEGMLQWGLRAAAMRLPFLPIRAGLGSDVMTMNPHLRTIRSPYGDGDAQEELLAMPAIRLDAALVHVNQADPAGNGQILSPDPYFDSLFCQAADKAFLSCERVVPTADLRAHGLHTIALSRMFTTGVVEAPGGARFTECLPDYPRDEETQKAYNATGKNPENVQAFWRAHLPRGVAK